MSPSGSAQTDLDANRDAQLWRRCCIRVFCAAVLIVVGIDVLPETTPLVVGPKRAFSPLLYGTGLWQGPWTLFAPNPLVRNAWYSAKLEDAQGRRAAWRSPYWADVGAWEKFCRFRHMNFYSRLHLSKNAPALEDLADYLVRNIDFDKVDENYEPIVGLFPSSASATASSRANSVALYRNQLHMALPPDGSLPTRDETVWTSGSELLLQRSYAP